MDKGECVYIYIWILIDKVGMQIDIKSGRDTRIDTGSDEKEKREEERAR